MLQRCPALNEAVKYAASTEQITLLSDYVESFSTGSLEAYRKSQKTWVTVISPRLENILGFVEPYRDPYGVRAEWEGAVRISDPGETPPGMYNFDRENLPLNLLTGKAIETCYQPGQTWTSVFEKLATSVEECRAMLVSYYLADNEELLSMANRTVGSANFAILKYLLLDGNDVITVEHDPIGKTVQFRVDRSKIVFSRKTFTGSNAV
ncbi:MAG: hypothetical protein Q9163_001397 [Psora crenata]